MVKKAALAFSGIAILVVDQAVKRYVLSHLALGESIPVLPGIFHLTLVVNTGCAFGMFKTFSSTLFIGISVLAVSGLAFFVLRSRHVSFPARFAAVLIGAGAFSNMVDRARLGHVVDFIDLRVWPVFNLADTAISTGVALLLLSYFIQKKEVRNDAPRSL